MDSVRTDPPQQGGHTADKLCTAVLSACWLAGCAQSCPTGGTAKSPWGIGTGIGDRAGVYTRHVVWRVRLLQAQGTKEYSH